MRYSTIEPDLADAIFGWVEDQNYPQGQHAGRVFFEDARFIGAQNGVWLQSKPITPHVLSGPKVTTFQHYLVQDRNVGHDPDRKETLPTMARHPILLRFVGTSSTGIAALRQRSRRRRKNVSMKG